jgi:hypothetical protein
MLNKTCNYIYTVVILSLRLLIALPVPELKRGWFNQSADGARGTTEGIQLANPQAP